MSTSDELQGLKVGDTSNEGENPERTEVVKDPAKNEEVAETLETVDPSQTTSETEGQAVKDVPVVEPTETEEIKEPVEPTETQKDPEVRHETETAVESDVKDVPVMEPTEAKEIKESMKHTETPKDPEVGHEAQTAVESDVKDVPVVEPTGTEDAETTTKTEDVPEKQEAIDQSQSTTEAEAVKNVPMDAPRRDSIGSFHIFDFMFLIVSTIVVVLAVKYLEIFSSTKPKLFTKEQLAGFDGSDGLPLYVAILGEIYDVSNGEKYYGKNKGYHCFVARDGTRAYITGEFVKDLTDDISDFNAEKHGALAEWRQFYRDHEEYAFVGVLIGAFYDEHGQPTVALKTVEDGAQQAERIKELRAEAKKLHPTCNSKWVQGKGKGVCGGQVWCDEGYPRMTVEFFPGASEKKRCACFKETDYSHQKQLYENCNPEASRCIIPPKDKEKGEPKRHT